MLAELGQLVQEEHTAMRQADLARSRPMSAAHQPGIGDGVVRRGNGRWRMSGVSGGSISATE